MTSRAAAALSSPEPEPTPAPRWWQFVRERGIYCPGGHHQSDTFEVTEAGFHRCAKWIDRERRECGLWIFLYAIRGGGIVVASVSLDERVKMRDLATPAAMLDYLGIFRRSR